MILDLFSEESAQSTSNYYLAWCRFFICLMKYKLKFIYNGGPRKSFCPILNFILHKLEKCTICANSQGKCVISYILMLQLIKRNAMTEVLNRVHCVLYPTKLTVLMKQKLRILMSVLKGWWWLWAGMFWSAERIHLRALAILLTL